MQGDRDPSGFGVRVGGSAGLTHLTSVSGEYQYIKREGMIALAKTVVEKTHRCKNHLIAVI